MTYHAPLEDIAAAMRFAGDLEAGINSGLYAELGDGMAAQIIEEAGKFATDRLAPLNRIGDKHGTPFKDGVVTTPPGWKEAYRDWAEAGWGSLTAPEAYGGQALPNILHAAAVEIWNTANMAFSLNPLLTQGAIEALNAHGSAALKAKFLPNMVSGIWTGSMNLTEPGSGSDLGDLKTRATRESDGTYRITGSKIFITYGEHDLTENIIHLVLARLPDAPAGTRGISLFVVPKFMVNDDGSLGARNDARCHSIEHKLGIHASPTCTMVFGDKGGAVGYLVGEENRGLFCMFTMMNNARLGVALQGVAIAERAYQGARAYADERKQGKLAGGKTAAPISQHADVKRMLLEMRTKTRAARSICYATAAALDGAHRGHDAKAQSRAALLTPIAKAYATDIGIEVASLGVQIHGGMGFVEETGAAQHYRDARIAAIYEGTNGIQAIDLVTRKLPLENGAFVFEEIARYRAVADDLAKLNHPAFGRSAAHLSEGVEALSRTTKFMQEALASQPEVALAGATPYLKLFAIVAGGTALAVEAMAGRDAALNNANARASQDIREARFYAENFTSQAASLEAAITEGAEAVLAA